MVQRAYVSFDWAAKKLLRQKSNFVILEGFLMALLDEEITIVDILESEGNQNDDTDKFNRVDLLAKNSSDELILIEVQNNHELDYFHRILYGTSKLIIDHMSKGMRYGEIKKIYSIHIVYFDLGQGEDYVYHGVTSFIGLNKLDELKLSSLQQNRFLREYAKDLFPEYYLLRVNDFDKHAVTPLEEWMEFLKTDFIKDDTTVKGLPEAKEHLSYSKLSVHERKAYDSFIEKQRYQRSLLETSYIDGHAEGYTDGRTEGQREMILALKKQGVAIELIATVSNLSIDEINNIS